MLWLSLPATDNLLRSANMETSSLPRKARIGLPAKSEWILSLRVLSMAAVYLLRLGGKSSIQRFAAQFAFQQIRLTGRRSTQKPFMEFKVSLLAMADL